MSESEDHTAATLREQEEEAETIGNTDPKGTVRLTRGSKRDLDDYGSTEAYCILGDQKFVVKVVHDD